MSFQSYSFGRIVFDNIEYESDIYVTTLGSVKERSEYCYEKFGTGHVLSKKEIQDNIDKDTELLIVGLGASSRMKIQEDALDWLKQSNIKVIAGDTLSATKTFNKIYREKKTFGIFHITC